MLRRMFLSEIIGTKMSLIVTRLLKFAEIRLERYCNKPGTFPSKPDASNHKSIINRSAGFKNAIATNIKGFDAIMKGKLSSLSQNVSDLQDECNQSSLRNVLASEADLKVVTLQIS